MMILIAFAIGVVALALIALLGHFQEERELNRRKARGEVIEEPPVVEHAGGCCGMHMTCERDSLLSAVSTRIVYYDDEELDRHKGRLADSYTEAETDEFRDILVSLPEDEVAGWIRSLQLRGVVFPEELLSELYLIIGEQRAYHMEHGPEARDVAS